MDILFRVTKQSPFVIKLGCFLSWFFMHTAINIFTFGSFLLIHISLQKALNTFHIVLKAFIANEQIGEIYASHSPLHYLTLSK